MVLWPLGWVLAFGVYEFCICWYKVKGLGDLSCSEFFVFEKKVNLGLAFSL